MYISQPHRSRLAVSCDGTHLHHINIHQFVDSPEWEANHDSSENTFQVTNVDCMDALRREEKF